MSIKKPLTRDEIRDAAEEWFPLFEEIACRMPTATPEDQLKALEHVTKLASHRRAEKEKADRDARFGFLKQTE